MAIICDFCSDPHPEWAFPSRDFAVVEALAGFKGGWAACDICKRLIDRDDYEGLARRSAELFVKKPEARGLPASVLIPSLRDLHARFRQNRTGPPKKLTEADKALGEDPT